MKKQMLTILLIIGMLIGAGGCIEGLMPTWKYPIIGGTWAKQEDEQRKTDNPYTRYFRRKENIKLCNRIKYLYNHPGIDEHIKKWIKEGWAVRGMNREQVIAAKGEPNDINRSVGNWGVHEQWIYGGYCRVTKTYTTATYLYFENGILTAYQY